MSYVTILWSMAAAAPLVLGFVHLMVWASDRRALANLAFAVAAISTSSIAGFELAMMHAVTPAAWGELVRWMHVPMFLAIAGVVLFVKQYFGTGRTWLAWTIIALRAVVLVGNFVHDPNFNFEEIRSLERIPLLGELVSVAGDTVVSRWQWVPATTMLLLAAFVVDAAVSLRRSGSPDANRRSLVVGGAVVAFVVVSLVHTQLVIYGVTHLPVMICLPFLAVVGAMAFELSRDLFVAARLERDLRESEQQLELTASAGGLALWSMDTTGRRAWATAQAREMFGLPVEESQELDLERVIAAVHADDAAMVRGAIETALASSTEFSAEFRVTRPDGSSRWLEAHGRPGADAPRRVRVMRGVLRDVTERRQVQDELSVLRGELHHVGRVSMLGQLASSIAHELSQPLGAILRNAEAAELMLRNESPDLEELRGIVTDIRRDDRRAGDVIDRLRALLKRRSLDLQPVTVESLVQDVASLVRPDASARGVALEYDIEPGLPMVSGDRVHLSQVLINLVINGMDAAAETATVPRRVAIRAGRGDDGTVELSVTDSGPGLPPGPAEKVFEPFYTTKPDGMGMGLPVSRTIVEAHGGRLVAESGPRGGATFRAVLVTAAAGAG